MVGVPRSKGCTTCRRRKVACDQTKPYCQNCQKRGVQCEGYARYPVILQSTGSGLIKRQRFEEVKPDHPGPSNKRTPSPPSPVTLIPYQPNVSSFDLSQIQVSCVNSYLPATQDAVQGLREHWMWVTMAMSGDLGRALSYSFQALCLSRIGQTQNDDRLVQQGRSQYVLGLNALQEGLDTPELAFQDRTLAAMRTLSIYEMVSLPFTSISAAHVHEQGMTQWCRAAGPQSINSVFALKVFEDVRWCIMNRDIEHHTQSLLASENWRTLPWQNFTKDSLQKLFDIGFELAGLLEQLDSREGSPFPEDKVSKTAQISLRCSAVRDELEEWYNWSAFDRDWQTKTSPIPPSGPPSPGQSGDVSLNPPEFIDFWEATNMVYCWLFKLILNDIMTSVVQDPSQLEQLAANSMRLALSIISASSWFLAAKTGWLGPQRFFFPIRQAMTYLKGIESPLAGKAGMILGGTVGRLRAIS